MRNQSVLGFFFFWPHTQVEKKGSPLNTLSHHLAGVLRYQKGERDMILLRHEVGPQNVVGFFCNFKIWEMTHSLSL